MGLVSASDRAEEEFGSAERWAAMCVRTSGSKQSSQRRGLELCVDIESVVRRGYEGGIEEVGWATE